MDQNINSTKKEISDFDKCLLQFLDIDKLKSLHNAQALFTEGFIACMDQFKSITSDIFGSYNFLDDPTKGILHNEKTKNSLFAKILYCIQDERNNTLSSLLSVIENEINSFEPKKMEELVLSIISKELNALVNLGAIIGLLLGTVNICI